MSKKASLHRKCPYDLFNATHCLLTMPVWACLHEGGGPQVGEVTCGGLPHLSCKRDHIKMRDFMDRRVTPSKRVTSPIWGTPPPCKQVLKVTRYAVSDKRSDLIVQGLIFVLGSTSVRLFRGLSHLSHPHHKRNKGNKQ